MLMKNVVFNLSFLFQYVKYSKFLNYLKNLTFNSTRIVITLTAQCFPKLSNFPHILKSKYNTQYDDTQSIGRRYRRQDEIGTPICVTIDFESVENDNAVTIRNRDTMEQIRVNIDRIVEGIEDSITEMY